MTQALNRAFSFAGAAPPLTVMPVAERWQWHARPADNPWAIGRVPLWRGGSSVGEDARAAAFDYARCARPASLALIEVDERGAFGAFEPDLPLLQRVLSAELPATVAALDAAGEGPPWLALTLSAMLDAEAVVVVLPPTASAYEPPAASALAALLQHTASPVLCHATA